MLKGVSKILNGDLLKALCDMGHGDSVAIVDANYPAQTMGKRVIFYSGINASELLQAMVDVFPLDHISKEPALLMELEPEDRVNGIEEPDIWRDFSDIIWREYGKDKVIGKISRQTFYNLSKDASLIIQTGEERLYGDLILIKGVVK